MDESEAFDIINYDDGCFPLVDKHQHYEKIYSTDLVLLAAKTAHSVVQSLKDSFGVKKMPAWEQTTTWYRAKMFRHVEMILYFDVRTISYHHKWVTFMTKRGWKYGEVYDRDNKIHPGMVRFNELPIEQQVCLKAFRAAVKPFQKSIGYDMGVYDGNTTRDIKDQDQSSDD